MENVQMSIICKQCEFRAVKGKQNPMMAFHLLGSQTKPYLEKYTHCRCLAGPAALAVGYVEWGGGQCARRTWW